MRYGLHSSKNIKMKLPAKESKFVFMKANLPRPLSVRIRINLFYRMALIQKI